MTQALRVLLVAPEPFYEDRGTPLALHHVLKAMSQLGYRVDVLTYPIGTSPELPGVQYLRTANLLGIRHMPIGFSWRKVWLDLFLFRALRRQLRRERYAIIHAVEEAAFLAVWAARRHRIPVIYDMQSSLAEQMAHEPLLRFRWTKALLRVCERWLLRRASRVVCSAGLAEHAKHVAPDADVQEWRYPGSVHEIKAVVVERLRAELNIAPQQPVVVYTGTFEEYQGLPLLVAAIPAVRARAPEAVFVFVGADGASAAGVERLLAGRAPLDSYRLLQRQPRELMPQFLAMADVVVSPRVRGGNVPIKIFDYLAACRPIVATAIPTHRSVLNDRLAVLAEPTAAGLGKAISDLLSDPDRRQQLAAAARAYAEQRLGWMRFVHSVAALHETTGTSR